MHTQNHEYVYQRPGPTWSNNYLWKPLEQWINAQRASDRRVFEVGCGNGATAGMLAELGFAVTAVDPSVSGIAVARENYSAPTFEKASAYEDLAHQFGTFPFVVSLEVIEHCYSPKAFASTIFNLLKPGGVAFISTPYHGYLKNLALAVTGKLDDHFTALWDGGHIKFWSMNTLAKLLVEAGFESVEFQRVGRIPPFAKSMVAIATKAK
mgnify:FL=1